MPFCEPVCSPVPTIPNGLLSCTADNDLDSKCTFECNQGFNIIGPPSTTCMLSVSDGSAKWNNSVPQCIQMCLPPLSTENGEVDCKESSFEGIRVGEECAYSCKKQFRMVGKGTTKCVISPDGLTIWDTPSPQCERKSNHRQTLNIKLESINIYLFISAVCLTPQPVDEGTFDCENDGAVSYLGQSCSLVCTKSSRIAGPNQLVCSKDNDGKAYWSGEKPTCVCMSNIQIGVFGVIIMFSSNMSRESN